MPLLLLLLLIVLFFLKKKPELKKIFFIAALAHFFILASIYLFLNPGFRGILNDGDIYSNHAGIIALFLKGIQFDSGSFIFYGYSDFLQGRIPHASEYGIGYITYLYSVFYAAYGYNPVYLSILNIMLNLLVGLIIFNICDMLFNRKTAFIALVLFLFNPVSLYYTTTMLKESLYILFFYLSIYLTILSVQKRNIIYFLLIIPLLFSIKLLKGRLLMPFLLVISIYYTVSFFSRKKLLFIVAPLLVLFFFLQFEFMYVKWAGSISRGAMYSTGYATTPGVSNYEHSHFGHYRIPLDTNIGRIMYLTNSWYHFIFEPIFSKKISIGMLSYYPFKLIYVLLSFSSVAGVYISFRHNKHYRRENILLLFFLFVIGSGLALASGNAGTMLRHRDIISPVIFIYASYFVTSQVDRLKAKGYRKKSCRRLCS